MIEEQFPEYVAMEPELLGHHLAHGGEPLRAAEFFELAGRRAARAAALAEAAAHYRHGIELLADLEPSRERDWREMWLGILLANAMMGSEGVGAATLRPVWNRAIELGERVGDADELTAASTAWPCRRPTNADLDAAIALARRQLAIADESGSRLARLRGHGTMGMALFYGGDGRVALEHFTASLAHYRPGDFHIVTFGVGHDQGIFARAMSRGCCGGSAGRTRRSTRSSDRGGGRAPRVDAEPGDGPPLPLPDPPAAPRERSRPGAGSAQRGVCRRAGLLAVAGGGPGRRGHRAGAHGDRAGLDEVGRGLALLGDGGTRSGISNALATLAEAHHAVGDTQAALGTVEAALNLSSEIGEPTGTPS